jgi:hypothetical protein
VVLAVVPWVAVAMATGGVVVAICFIVVLAIVGGLGFLGLKIGMNERGELLLLLSVPLGFIFASSILALAARLGGSVRLIGWVLAVTGVVGLSLAGRWLRGTALQPIRHRLVYFVLSVVVCAVYFSPGAWRDGRSTSDGGFRWIYVDTQYLMAVSASVMTDHGRPAHAGLATAPLTYHFAPYAVSGTLSAMTGLEVPDTHVRVVRGLGLIALMLSALALGRILGRRLGNAAFAGIAAVVGLFFYGSLSALFEPQFGTTATTSFPPLLFLIPHLEVTHDGGWFSHLVLGHSDLWAGIGMLVTLALLADRVTSRARPRLPLDLFVLVPGLVACLNSIAGVGMVGVVGGVYFLVGIWRRRAWLLGATTLIAAGAAIGVMGYVGSSSAAGVALDVTYAGKAFMLWCWLFVGLGVRIAAFGWSRRWRDDPMVWMLALLVVGYITMGLFIRDDFDSHNLYALRFLQGVLSVFAFAWLGAMVTCGGWRETVAAGLLRWCGAVAALLLLIDVMAFGIRVVRGDPFSVDASFSLKLASVGALAVLVGSSTLLAWRHLSPRSWRVVPAVLFASLSLGSFAWLPPWMAYGLNRLGLQVTLSPDEVTALRWVRDSSEPDALLATNHHAVAKFRLRQERSYGYRVIAERPILLEGWEYGEKYDPRFAAVRNDNDLLFSTNDSALAHRIIDRYGVQFVVTAPATDLHIAGDLPWLKQVARFGAVKVYETVPRRATRPRT